MNLKKEDWLGSWINFERMIHSTEPAMVLAWREAENMVMRLPPLSKIVWRQCKSVLGKDLRLHNSGKSCHRKRMHGDTSFGWCLWGMDACGWDLGRKESIPDRLGFTQRTGGEDQLYFLCAGCIGKLAVSLYHRHGAASVSLRTGKRRPHKSYSFSVCIESWSAG